jgi:hypothetical protein
VLLVGVSAVVLAFVGMLLGIVDERRDAAARNRMNDVGAADASRRVAVQHAA